ncbi:hypothetical protein BGX33_006714 [Mortierella sp. NVP41]|nr:hypothetical protein BGX33_006714 [Mortierella sp. NVP41]
MEALQAAWPPIDPTKISTTPTFFTAGYDMSRSTRPSLYSQLVRPKAEQEFLQALLAPLDADHSPSGAEEGAQSDPFQVIYRHLHEKHYLDRLVHAFYHHLTRKEQSSHTPADIGRVDFHNKVRVIYPRPSEIRQAIDQARGDGTQEPAPLLYFLLTEPELRFRLCMIAHLIEVVFAIGNGTWNGEKPRQLPKDEADYAMTKLQDLFKELFQKPDEQASLRRFLTILYEWISADAEAEEDVGEEGENQDTADEPATRHSKLKVPAIVKEISPCWQSILQEIQNIKIAAIGDISFQAECAKLFRFLFLSLKTRDLTFADDWADEANQALGPMQDSLASGKYRGPAQRLIREIVCMTDQLWEGGGATDTSLAVEKCLTIMIQKSLQGSTGTPDPGAGVGSNVGWDVMCDFEILIQAASRNIAPIPLPSIAWKRSDSEVALDAAVLEFPHLMPSNVHLNATTAYDRQTNKSCRLWHLKISGLEVEAKKVAYKYTSKTYLGGNVMDEGELDLVIPSNSLDIEVTFVLTPPTMRRGAVTAHRHNLDTIGQRHPIASAARENLFTTSLEAQGAQYGRRRSTSSTRLGRDVGFPTAPSRTVRFSDTASSVGRTVARTDVRFREQVQENVTEDFWSAVREIVNRFLYPNRPYLPSLSRQQGSQQQVQHPEPSSAGRLAANERMTLGRPRRRLSVSGNGTRPSGDPRAAAAAPATPGVALPLASDTGYYQVVVEPTNVVRRKFVELKECRVDLRRLNVDVLETQHPILQMLTHPVMVRRLRKAIERTLREMVVELVNTVNTGVDQIMEATREQPQTEAEEGVDRSRQREATTATTPQRSYEPVQKTAGTTGIITAMPLYAGVY